MIKQAVSIMGDHDLLLRRIGIVLKRFDWTPRAWSLQAVGKADAIRNIQRGGSKAPRTDTVRKLAKAAGVRVEWLMGEGPDDFEAGVPTDSEGFTGPGVAIAGRLPLLGYIGAGDQVYHFGIGEARVEVPAPPGVTRGVAAEVRGGSMLPVYRDGDMVIASEHLGDFSELVGKDCFVQIVEGPLYLKILRKGAKGRFNLESYNDSAVIANQAVEWVAPVAWVKRAGVLLV